jgi:hypothetical protein
VELRNMGDAPTINEIKDMLYKLRDELTSLEEKIRKRQCREAQRQVGFIIDDLGKIIDIIEEYALSNPNNEEAHL